MDVITGTGRPPGVRPDHHQTRGARDLFHGGDAPASAVSTAMAKISVGVITHAQGAHLGAYFDALAACEEVDDVVLSDPSGRSYGPARKALGEKLAATYESREAMLREAAPDLALVSYEAVKAPPEIDAALEAGCHVFAEKPACVRVGDFEKLVRKAEAKERQLMLALANRVTPAVQEAKRIIERGALGDIYGVEAHIIADQTRLKSKSYQANWYAQKARAGGGHLIWLGIHWLDLTMYLTGSDIVEVAGFAGNVGGQPIDVEDSAAVTMKYSNGSFGTLTSGYYLDRRYHSHIRIWGSGGWLEYTEWLGERVKSPLKWYSTVEPKTNGVQIYDGPLDPRGYTPFLRECVRACAGLRDAPVTGREGLRVLKTIHGFYTAAATGRTQQVGS